MQRLLAYPPDTAGETMTTGFMSFGAEPIVLTTVTDVVGFGAFLGLAALALSRGAL